MDVSSLLLELYGRISPAAQQATEGVDLARLTEPPATGANPIAWLVWHLARVQDHDVADFLGVDQIWISGGWAERFGLAPDPSNTGYGNTAEEVAAVRPERPEVLTEYLDAVDRRTQKMLNELTPAEFDRVIDPNWDPPVTFGVRLISIAEDSLQHCGQAGYVRGLLGL